ncbi:MAG TPA: farnesyl diphosphate synthase [Planctomycetota bacterium]|nr:farnesyl diphosphate synthase [Planctomycetota bacterium]
MESRSQGELAAWLDDSRRWAERALDRHIVTAEARAGEARITEVMRYALLGGGKRMRPALVRLMCRELGGSDADAERPAAAVEAIHAYSLAHDDLPCMDDDDLRRGRPSCHKVFGEALALLAGDALQTAAFECLANDGEPRAIDWIRVLSGAAGARGMVGGQVLDMTLSGKELSLDSVRAMQRGKTGALIAAAAEMGAIAAGATSGRREEARAFGSALGALFQVVDDILDVVGVAAELGKTPGKDARHEKPTIVAVLGLDGAWAEAQRTAEDSRRAARRLGLPDQSLGPQLVDWLLERRR